MPPPHSHATLAPGPVLMDRKTGSYYAINRMVYDVVTLTKRCIIRPLIKLFPMSKSLQHFILAFLVKIVFLTAFLTTALFFLKERMN